MSAERMAASLCSTSGGIGTLREPDAAQQVVPARVGAERLVAERGLTISSGVDGELRGADRIAVSVRLRSHEAADG